jgi:hypothetical protein
LLNWRFLNTIWRRLTILCVRIINELCNFLKQNSHFTWKWWEEIYKGGTSIKIVFQPFYFVLNPDIIRHNLSCFYWNVWNVLVNDKIWLHFIFNYFSWTVVPIVIDLISKRVKRNILFWKESWFSWRTRFFMFFARKNKLAKVK